MRTRRLVAAAIAYLAGSATAVVVTPTPAQADSAHGCAYPYVCFYRTRGDFDAGLWAARYRDITKIFQNLGPNARGADVIWNTRNDDVAYLRFDKGVRIRCLPPNSGDAGAVGIVDGIRISSAAKC
jgi:hypothetical protein